jgi:acyl CoA:acetate/3-ketoacid CoA transferase beta subunit
MAVVQVTADGLVLKEVASDTTVEAVLRATEADLRIGGDVGRF